MFRPLSLFVLLMQIAICCGNPTVSYVYGLDLISQKTGSATRYYHYDAQGSTRLLTDSSGEITDSFIYDAFGIEIDSDVNTTPVRYRYTGEQWDGDIGMYYLRARYYDPQIGRFMTRDPFEGIPANPLTLHPYLYAHNNPVNMVDPTGTLVSSPSFLTASGLHSTLRASRVPVILAAKRVAIRRLGQAVAAGTVISLSTSTTSDVDDISTEIYRGVPKGRERDYKWALLGIAKPRGTRLDYETLEQHVRNETVKDGSGVTSWTTKRNVAKRFSGLDGIILEVDFFTVRDRVVPRPTIPKYFDEHEILLRGIIVARPTNP